MCYVLSAQTLATQFYLEGDKLNINLIVILNLRCSGVLAGSEEEESWEQCMAQHRQQHHQHQPTRADSQPIKIRQDHNHL